MGKAAKAAKQAAKAAAAPAAAPRAAAPAAAPAAVSSARTAAPAVASSSSSKQQAKQDKKAAKQDVKQATKTVKQSIKAVTPRTGALADPAAYNQALAVLQSAGKAGKATKFESQYAKAVQKDTAKGIKKGYLPSPTTTAPTQEISSGLDDFPLPYEEDDEIPQEWLDLLDAERARAEGLEGQLGELGSQVGGLQGLLESLQNSRSEMQGYQPQDTSISTSTTTEEYEPFSRDLFTSLLGELESSKKRQKDWDYEQALKAYKF